MDIDWARHIVIGLVAMLAVFALATWGGKSPPDQHGWRSIKPGAIYAIGIGLGTVMTLGMAWVWLFVGSDRADGAAQMRILFWLIVAFGTGTLITTLQFGQLRRAAMRWRGDRLAWRDRKGSEHSRKLGEATALRRAFLGPVFVVFEDGVEARIDPNATNALALIEVLSKRLDPPEQ